MNNLREKIEEIVRDVAIGVTSQPLTEDSFSISMPPDPEQATVLILNLIKESLPKEREDPKYHECDENAGFNLCLSLIKKGLE